MKSYTIACIDDRFSRLQRTLATMRVAIVNLRYSNRVRLVTVNLTDSQLNELRLFGYVISE